ncbi:MAG: NAD(P)/FAD-dependent oxidoreductase [Oscillospiraceae bacterium]|nr:NAD(P)/FAD-dependent oxidoreductase [Oscillospiraceae bacterium]
MNGQTIERADLVVIGGGAAGLMCAVNAAERGLHVVLLEPNQKLGRKLRITGKGRCNLTNACDIKSFMANIPGDARFLYSALNRFSPSDAMDWFESRGLPLKVERGSRVFPVSDRADDVAELLSSLCRKNGVRVIRCPAKAIVTDNGAVSAVVSENGPILCRAAAVCTGGLSYPLTGSTGDGYRFARSFGHRVTQLQPSLVPLESEDAYCEQMQGFSLKNVVLSAYEDETLIYKELGEMLFTHFGVSGPLVLSASAHMRDFEHKKYRLSIDLKPGLDEKKLDLRLLRDFEKYANREFKNALQDLAGRAMIPVLVQLSGIPEETKVNEITKEQRRALLRLLKAFPVSVARKRPIAEAIVTSGGVDLKEINPRTMESKLIGGLYFSGEVLDLDAYTGGFNLQIAWSTGFVAGRSVLKEEE